MHNIGRTVGGDDVAERVIYNAFLSGISLEGDRFFYPNRLASFEGAERAAWFGCACCPGNIARFVASVPGYVYATKGRDVYVNLYAAGKGELKALHPMARIDGAI